MKKNIAITLATAVMSIFAANAQVEETSYGRKINDNFNLRFEKSEKVHTEISVGGHVSGGDISAYGVDLGVARVYTPSKNTSWTVGGLVSSEFADKYGSLNDVLAVGGVRFGNTVSLELDALAGVGQMSFYDESTNGESIARYYNSQWRLKVGAQAAVNFKLSKSVSLSVFGRYLYAINREGDRTYNEAEGWTAAPTEFHTGKWSVGATLSIALNNNHQVSGDNCWSGGLYTGYRFKGNEGAFVEAELLNTKRVSAKGARVLGFGAGQVFGEGSQNSVFVKGGYQVLPQGAKSPIVLEFGVKAGLEEYAKTESAATDTESYSMKSKLQSLGVVGKVYGGVNFHFGRHNIKVAAEGGYHTCFGTNFSSATSNYVGSTGKLSGADLGVTIGYSIAF